MPNSSSTAKIENSHPPIDPVPITSQTFRSTKSSKEILSILNQAPIKSGIFLWQSIIGPDGQSKRVCIDIKIQSVDLANQRLKFEVIGDPSPLNLVAPVFVKVPIKDCAFKTSILDLKIKMGVLDFPFEMVLSENRGSNRIKFKDEDNKTVTVQNAKSTDQVLALKGQILKVANVSYTGLCAIITHQQNLKYNVNDKLVIMSLGDFKLTKPIDGLIVQKVPYEKRSQFGAVEAGARIGIKFSEPIPKEVFEQYTFVESLVTFNDVRFFKDQAFRESIQAGMKKTLDTLLKNQKIQHLFKRLEIQREENRYLKNHIELLCEVLCQVGKDVGWITERNLDKLIYIAYLHDIRYFEHPHLARIGDSRDFEFQKNRLTTQDRDVFYEGPTYAAEIAKEDDSAFPDAHKILIQQKERPDGKGFPNAIRSSQLAPLSCLLMICHEFVDYIIDEEEWSFEEFVKRYQRIYTGPYFYKIFQVFERIR